MTETHFITFFVIALLIICLIFGYYLGLDVGKQIFEKELIKKGLAQYNPTTGEWEYKS